MSGYLLDTNVPSELTRLQSEPRVESWLEEADDDLLYISALSLGELVKGIDLLPASRRRAELQSWLDQVLRPWFSGRVLPVDEAIAKRWGRLSAAAQLSGRQLNVTDGLIAATALEHGLTLVTRNVSDFRSLGLPILNPWESN